MTEKEMDMGKKRKKKVKRRGEHQETESRKGDTHLNEAVVKEESEERSGDILAA